MISESVELWWLTFSFHAGCLGDALSLVSVGNKPIVWITCIILKSRNELCPRNTPPPPRIMTFCFTLEIHATIVTYSSTVTLL